MINKTFEKYIHIDNDYSLWYTIWKCVLHNVLQCNVARYDSNSKIQIYHNTYMYTARYVQLDKVAMMHHLPYNSWCCKISKIIVCQLSANAVRLLVDFWCCLKIWCRSHRKMIVKTKNHKDEIFYFPKSDTGDWRSKVTAISCTASCTALGTYTSKQYLTG